MVSSPDHHDQRKLSSSGFFAEALDWQVRRTERSWESFVLAVIGPDAPLGSDVLAAAIAGAIRGCDLAARLDDRRVGVLLIRSTPESLPAFAERLTRHVKAVAGPAAGFAVGAASHPVDGTTAVMLMRAAEAALERALSAGEPRERQARRAVTPAGTAGARVLVVDDDAQNRKLIRACLAVRGWAVTEADDGARGLSLIRDTDFDLVFLDVMMPGMNGYEVCRRIKSQDPTRAIPVVLVTALDDIESRVAGIQSGADDFLTKPFHIEEVTARAASLIRLKKANSGMTNTENVLMSLAAAIEAKDQYTQGHTDRTARMATTLGQRLGLTDDEINSLRIGGVLHDVGKIGVPESILNKEGPLTDEEWRIMKTHPEIGYRICESLRKTLGNALDVIRHHHEKLDGSSYPDGLRGDQIAMVSRIMGVVDVFDALTTDRPYRRALGRDDAFGVLRSEVDKGKLDGGVVEALITLVLEGHG
jgi:putative two-component system response regulator